MGALFDFPTSPGRGTPGGIGHGNKLLVGRFVAAINRQDWAALAALLSEDFVRHSGAGGTLRGAAALIDFLRQEFEAFPDASESVEDLLAEGDRVAVRHRFRGTQRGPLGAYAPTGRVLDAPYLAIYRIEGERIAEAWAEWDSAAGLRQLGHLP